MIERIRVLLIEDNPGDARLIEHFLSRSSEAEFELEHVDRVAKGIAKLRDPQVDVVLLDMSLPDSDPRETFPRVYAAGSQVPIIVLTGVSDDERALQAVREGAQDYLVKRSVDSAMLSRSIRYAIERKRSEEALRESRERYALAVRGANDGLWDWNLRVNSIYFSPRWREMLGIREQADATGGPEMWFERIHPQDVQSVRRAVDDHLTGKTPHFQSEHRMRHQTGRYLWVLSRGLAVRDDNLRPYRMAGSLTDVTERKQYEDQLQHDAFHDTLTQLPNRALFLDRLKVCLAHTQRRENYRFAVLFLDLDRFKNINDSLGHMMGDEMLTALSSRLLSLLRQGDTVARLGGDEFAILLDDIDDNEQATAVAARILEQLGQPLTLSGHEVYTTASMGIAFSSSGHQSPEELLRDADLAMYRAKSSGKNQFTVFDRHMHDNAVALLQLENDLRRAIDREEFAIHYQPIVSLTTGRLNAFEALVRWQHPERGLLSPDVFIPIAEETGLIVDIGRYVIRSACRQMAEWHRRFPHMRGLSISVNLASKEFLQPDFEQRLDEVLAETGLDAAHLRLEITESMIMEQNGTVLEKLERLRARKIELHIDDFGTGYSSLSYLHQLPADTLKIDRSFVTQMGNGGGRTEIVGTIVSLARNLGMTVAAEGLETVEQLSDIRKLQCQYGQGFLFSKPLAAGPAESLLASEPRWMTQYFA